MTIDTQKDHFWFVIRAWGQGFKSRRIHHGRVTRFEDLAALLDLAYWPYEANAFPPIRCHKAGIDSGAGKAECGGSRTDEVYQWCLKDPIRRIPLKGESEPRESPIRLRHVTYRPPDARRDPYQVWLHLIDSHYFNDLLASAITATVPVIDRQTGEVLEEDLWQLNACDDGEYNRHLANLHKVIVKSRSGRSAQRWMPKTAGARVDLRMCESYQYFMAHGPANCAALPTPDMMAAQARAANEAANRPAAEGLTTPDGRAFLATQR